ncbi:cysteine--tRNA ligase [Acuticoccus sp.]|uniref:cysteine--tRNA ligase n=1 Tax=Acuticoccus sp. TaxID=1904378 RepID=UPI003B52EF54
MDPLTLYDTRTRAKVQLVPRDPASVRMYACGPTVYARAHIGNARPLIVFDVLFRVLRRAYGEACVTYVRNITDVEDKINVRAREEGVSIGELTAATIRDFHEDVGALGCLPPTHEPRATDHVGDMRTLIEALVARGHAYTAQGHVLFAVGSLASYGTLSHRSLDEMVAGARVEVAPYKRDPMDFVLWKPSREGEPAWDSPAGIAEPGRPGWHIECSAMAHHFLGETFDIHGGGIDLVFPHHENERAQTCAGFAVEEMASVWMHNGFLQVEGRKMAKSEGNFVTIRDALGEASGDVLRLAMLMTHYRQPIGWTARRVADARELLRSWSGDVGGDGAADAAVVAALHDDLNTPRAVARLGELALERSASLGASAGLLGLDLARVAEGEAAAAERRARAISIDVDALVAQRLEARVARRFADADAIRDRLAAEGIALRDGKDEAGRPTTTWTFAD